MTHTPNPIPATSAPFDAQQVAALKWLQKGEVFCPDICSHVTGDNRLLPVILCGLPLKVDASGLTCSAGHVRESVPAALLDYAIARKDRLPVAPVVKERKGKR